MGLITAWNFRQYDQNKPQVSLKELLLKHQTRCWVANQIIVEEGPEVPGLMYVSQAVQGDGDQSKQCGEKRSGDFPEPGTPVANKRSKTQTETDQSMDTIWTEEVSKTEFQDQIDDNNPLLSRVEKEFCDKFVDKPS